MAAIPVPSVNTPTYQTWAAAVAGRLNAAERWDVGLTGTATTDTVGISLGGSITVPTSTEARILICSFTVCSTAAGQGFDFYIVVGGVNRKRVRVQPNTVGHSGSLTYHHPHNAGTGNTGVAVKAASVTGSAAFALLGTSDLNFLQVTSIPVA